MAKAKPMPEGMRADLDFLAEAFDEGIRPGEFTVADAMARYGRTRGTTERILERFIKEGRVTRRKVQGLEGRQCWAYSEVKK